MSTVRPNLKAFACFDLEKDDFVASTGFAVLRPRKKGDSHFILHSILSAEVERQIRQRVVGSSYPAINTEDVAGLLLYTPPAEQRGGIASVLDAVDDAIRHTTSAIEKLKNIKAGLLHDLLTRGIDHNGRLRNMKRNPQLFKDSPIGRVPCEWDVKPLGTLCGLLNGRAFKPSDWTTTGMPIIRIQNLNGSQGFNFFNRAVDEKYLVNKGTLLFAWSGNRGTSFGPFIWPGPTGILNQHIFRVVPADGVRPHWFFYALDDVRQRVEKAAHGAIGLVHVRRTDLVKYMIGVPDEREQMRIEATLGRHIRRIEKEEERLRKFVLIKSGLMHDLLSGRVRLPAELMRAGGDDPPEGKVVKLGANIHFKRAVLAAEVVDQMHEDITFGHVKFMKTLYLVEQLAELELESHYLRAAAGPFDNRLLRSVDAQLKKKQWFDKVPRTGGKQNGQAAEKPLGWSYVPLAKRGEHRPWFEKYWGGAQAKIQAVMNLLKPLDTQRCEILATLYEAWRALASGGKTVSDAAIVDEVLLRWHESKQAIPRERWLKALEWMRREGMIPKTALGKP